MRVRGECGGDCGVTRHGRCSAGKVEEGDGTAMRARAVSDRSARRGATRLSGEGAGRWACGSGADAELSAAWERGKDGPVR